MTGQIEWVLLSYRIPREPSTPRIAVWRRLRRLGVLQVSDGLVGLPADARTREQLDWIAEEVIEAGGEALVWLGRLATRAQERAVAQKMTDATADEYRAVTADAETAAGESVASRRRTAARLRRELDRISRRDFFPPPERDEAQRAVRALDATIVDQVAANS